MKLFLLLASLLAFSVPAIAEKQPGLSHLSPLSSPWTGGLNACQFGRIDLDDDGLLDLVVFDRHGDRLLCFLNRGRRGEIDYQYTSAYDACFPKLTAWVVFADYDGDGKEDIFTYAKGWAGIKVYRNISDGLPEFQPVVDHYLSSWQGGGEVNILSTEADYPAIIDIDDDGDLDILTFGVMGTFIEKHLNRSVERYGCRDSLVFEKTDPCWGHVAESEENNVMYLDTCLFGNGLVMPVGDIRHRGATLCIRDLTGDELPDLLLADVDYPGLTLLINGGDESSPTMVSQTLDFPTRHPVRLFSMPVPFFTDIDNDGVDDLLVSPFDPDPMASAGDNSVWLYLNRGTNANPDFQLATKSFLQEMMLDVGTGAYPVLTDLDQDGLLDVVVGTIGNIDSIWYFQGNLEVSRQAGLTWLRNVGTASTPAFEQQAFPYELPALDGMMGIVPAFADMDDDGRLEMLVGTAAGRLLLYDDDGTLLDDDFLHYDKAWSAPCFFDVNQDGVTDLVVGNASGRLTFFKGEDSSSLIRGFGFVKITDFWGGVDVRDYGTSYYGYSVPALFRSDGTAYLSVGSESGKLFLFDGIDDSAAVFNDISDRWTAFAPLMPLRFGLRSAPAVADLDGNGKLEVIVGNFSGGLQLYNASIPVGFSVEDIINQEDVSIYPNPVHSQMHIVTKGNHLNHIMIFDLLGRKWQERQVNGSEVVVNLSTLPSGAYLLVVSTGRGLVSRIFFKR